MAYCPRCNSPARLTGKEWNYNLFYVKQFICSTCEKTFMEYYRNGELSHTIPKDSRIVTYPENIRRKVIDYLKKHKCVSFDQIVKDLELSDDEVLGALIKMEMDGLVEKIEDDRKTKLLNG